MPRAALRRSQDGIKQPLRRGRLAVAAAGLAAAALLAVSVALHGDELRGWWILRRHFERLETASGRFPEYRHLRTGIVMVLLPGGTFRMGSAPGERGSLPHERPEHPVSLDPFLIAKYEVSQAEWEMVAGHRFFLFKGRSLPAHGVSWLESKRFCEDAGLALPTEAQWEYAARAGAVDPEPPLRAGRAARPGRVDGGAPNRFGIHNLCGNVEEWCEDTYAADFYARPEAGGRNPLCASGGESRVARGGSFVSDDAWRPARRNPLPFSAAGVTVGLRPVFNLAGF